VSRVAVCIPAHGEVEPVARLLGALAEIGAVPPAVQVVVAIDGPDPALEALARGAGVTTVVLPTNGGSYAARNGAIDALDDDVELVLFTDTDCVPRPGWVEAHVRVLDAGTDLSAGAIVLHQPDPPTPASYLDASWHLDQRRHVETLGFGATANLALRRDVLRVHRFDATLRSGGDRELCRRAGAAGASIAYTPDAIVDHPARATAGALRTKVHRIAEGIAMSSDPPAPPSLTPIEVLRHLRAARRQGAVRTPRQAYELMSLWADRALSVRRALRRQASAPK
jgi:GT2 family glycosyltransferase